MIEVCAGQGAVTAVDAGKNEVTVGVDRWRPAEDGPPLDRRVDGVAVGTVRRLTFAEAAVSIEHVDGDRWGPLDRRAELGPGPYLLKVELPVVVYVAIAAPCRVDHREADGGIVVSFDRPATVTLGFRSRLERPRETLTVPPTLEGACTAIRWQAAGLEASTPDKSYPSKRLHPPAIAFGERTAIPAAVTEATVTSDVTLAVPRRLDALLVAAPLAYYLQADLALAGTDAVELRAPALDAPVRLGAAGPLERDVAAVLSRAFNLDCLVRNAGRYSVELEQAALLDELGLDAARLYGRSDGERLAAYLAADYSRVAGRLPDWHLSTVVSPALEALPALPYLLHRLSLVQLPDPVSVGQRELVAESVPESYVSPRRRWNDVPTYELIRNRTHLGALQAWLADGTPVDAFRATEAAFANRFRYFERSDGPRTVVVVLNDAAMLDEREAVEGIYRDRAEELAIEVTVREALSRAELRETLAAPVDFLHYVGHCDADGLRCRDGAFSTAELERTDVQTFFLNACGSFEQGLELVRRGSVAGAVTLVNVLNREATRVGMTFARLVMHGFSVSRALALASRHSLTHKFYGVVGDGTHRLAQGEDAFPAELTAEAVGPKAYDLRFSFPSLPVPGGLAKPRHPPAGPFVLRGCPTSARLDRESFVRFLRSVEIPVVLDGAYHWSTELAAHLEGKPDAGVAAEGGG